MDTETVNQGTNETGESRDNGARTFTQAELDAIVGDRLARERSKYADYETLKDKAARFDAAEEAGKTELQKANDKLAALTGELDRLKAADAARQIRDKVSAETGVPANLLTADTEEACKAQAAAIKQYAGGSRKYPDVKDGGEVSHSGGGKTRDQFKDWFNERMNK